MHHAHLATVIPLDRYRAILAALEPERETWLGELWLRVAAHVTVLSPEEPEELARRIRALAEELHAQARWYQDLASPLRFTVAALLVQHGITVERFLAEHTWLSSLLHAAGLRSHGFHHSMTVLIMLISPAGERCGEVDTWRIRSIYQGMKRFHWWLTGPEDLPACAALAQCPGSPAELVTRAEACYMQLAGTGLAGGDQLQTAANLLTLTGLSADHAVARFQALRTRVLAQSVALTATGGEALAMLCLLDHAPDLIVERLLAMARELDLLQPDVPAGINLVIAADLTCLDLVRFDRDLLPVKRTAQAEALLRTLHTFHLADAALLGRLDQDLEVPFPDVGTGGWPGGM